MYLPLAVQYPSWIHPEIFPGVPILGLIRWYGLMYIVAFSVSFYLLKKLLKEGAFDTVRTTEATREVDAVKAAQATSLKKSKIATNSSIQAKTTEDDVFSFLSTGIVFLLIGARVFSALIYDTSKIYWHKPWLIFWPFDESGKFTGLAGMSYHGGFVGGFIGLIFWCIKNKKNCFKWIDCMACAIPAGYTFGRLGNFFNGELYGRITSVPWGVIFPHAEKFSKSLPWVQEFAHKCSINISPLSTLVNLPRHPSQLYEALFEGVILFLIIWFLRKKKPFDGFLTSLYIFGYGFFRFIIEYFREPDADIGYRFSTSDAPIYLNTSFLNISTGQILCFLMILLSIALAIFCFIKSKHKR